METRLVIALEKHLKAQPDFTSDQLIHIKNDAKKIADAAIKAFMQKINEPTFWIGTVESTISNREDLAINSALNAAAKTYFQSDEFCVLPEFLAQSMGFYSELTPKGIQKLEQAGIALFGSRWQTELAASLKNADGKPLDARRIRQWLAGERPVPIGVWTDIKLLAEQRKQQIDELIGKLQ